MKKLTQIPFTKEGFDKIKNDYEQLVLKRVPAVKELTRAREMGDLSENGLYKAARSQLSSIDAQLRKIKLHIKLGVVIDPTTVKTVQIGTSVKVLEDNDEKTYHIVGDLEANPKENKISSKSPIGSALIGRNFGETAFIQTPKKKYSLKILQISI